MSSLRGQRSREIQRERGQNIIIIIIIHESILEEIWIYVVELVYPAERKSQMHKKLSYDGR